MNDPRRLRDEADSTVELMLLDAGVSYRGSETARAKTLAALGLAGSAAVSAGAIGAASAASSSVVSKLGWAKALLISGVGVTAVAPVGYMAWQRTRAHTVSVSAPAAPAPVIASPRTLELEPVPIPEIESPPPAPPAKSEARTSSPSALAAELSALDDVRSRLAAGNASGALTKLDDYARTFPHGRLVLEAEVLRIDALSRAGQGEQAKKRAEAFLRRHPNSVLASRVRGYIE